MSAYRDVDGDVWEAQEDGRYHCLHLGMRLRLSLDEVDATYGPLTALREEAEPMDSEAPGMTRVEALARAVECVDKLKREHPDGVYFAEVVAAVDTLARFLMGEAAPE